MAHRHAGPRDPSVLFRQQEHVSQRIWEGAEARNLISRRAFKESTSDPHQRMLPYLQNSGFIGVAHMGFVPVDYSLIAALVERWRPETHTFHMPPGECTITLEDIALLTGLPIDGRPVTGRAQPENWKILCRDLLGHEPYEGSYRGNRIKLDWLAHMGGKVQDIDGPELVQQRTRAYIMRLIGGFLFADHSSNMAHVRFLPMLADFATCGTYSWGSAVLAFLYRELCKASIDYSYKEMLGPIVLLQLWAWHRFPTIAPRIRTRKPDRGCYGAQRNIYRPLGFRWTRIKIFSETPIGVVSYYRNIFDKLHSEQITWQPYTEDVISTLPAFCSHGRDIYLAIVPLICFNIIEWIQPDRVMRQFGLDQPVPLVPMQNQVLHEITLKGKSTDDWAQKHAEFVSLWDLRAQRCVTGSPLIEPLGYVSQYMKWYRSITRRWISPECAKTAQLEECLALIQLWSYESDDNRSYTGEDLREIGESIYDATHYVDDYDDQLHHAPSPVNPLRPHLSEQVGEGKERRKRMSRARSTTNPGQSSSSIAESSHHATSYPPQMPPPSYYTQHLDPYPPFYPGQPSYNNYPPLYPSSLSSSFPSTYPPFQSSLTAPSSLSPPLSQPQSTQLNQPYHENPFQGGPILKNVYRPSLFYIRDTEEESDDD